jgi:hypothetical protein
MSDSNGDAESVPGSAGPITIEPNLSAAHHAEQAAWHLEAVRARQRDAHQQIREHPGSKDLIAEGAGNIVAAHQRMSEVHALAAIALALTGNAVDVGRGDDVALAGALAVEIRGDVDVYSRRVGI